MSSRQEQKQRRREERLAAERAAAARHARLRRARLAVGGLLGVGLLAGIVLAATSGGNGGGTDGRAAAAGNTPALPEPRLTGLQEASRAAGCTLTSPPIEGQGHVTNRVAYRTNPPTSGEHNPEPALDGIYTAGNAPQPEKYVHALEHGRVVIHYRPGTPARRAGQLETLANEPLNGKDAYKVLLVENNTGMRAAVAATAWGQVITCRRLTDRTYDALRAFRVTYVDKGPEVGIPPNN